MDKIRVLQLGAEDWGQRYRIPAYVELNFVQKFTGDVKKPFDAVFLDREPMEEEYPALHGAAKAHTLFVTDRVPMGAALNHLYRCKCGQMLAAKDIADFLVSELRYYYAKPYGEKYKPQNLAVAESFTGKVRWFGGHHAVFEGDFGSAFRQVAFWRNNIPLRREQPLDLWLEYHKDPEVEIVLEITQFAGGSLAQIINRWEFSETDLKDVVHIEGNRGDGSIFASIRAKGKGRLAVIALHDRYSRGGHGHFLPGGERVLTSEREEIFAYFDPGDRKPPLNVYFSGYKTLEGFEGYNMMRGLGCPFLLISEPRLEGGCFYMGSEEYEALLVNTLRRYMAKLRFSSEQVIFSGLSMGTFGALYYGCDLHPHALILGKPLANIGNVATNEKLFRPGGFPTSLDVLKVIGQDTDADAVARVNEKLWSKFEDADWSATKFIISYMIEDDYDKDAYTSILSHLRSDGAQVYGKGIHGRHNDNTNAIVNWFLTQYHKVLAEDFHRREWM